MSIIKYNESGEYVGKGSFIIRGKKNYMAQVKLELGLGILFLCGKGDNYQNILKYNICYDEDNEDNSKCLGMIICSSPYRSMNNFKYKVKIIPGNQKRGKIILELKNKFKKICNNNNNIEKSYINMIDNKIMDYIPINSCIKI